MAQLPDTGGAYMTYNGRALAVFRVGPDEVCVFDDVCPHAGASLSGGYIDQDCVVCPWHAWSFHVGTGQCPDNPAIKITTYLARVVKGRVWIQIGA